MTNRLGDDNLQLIDFSEEDDYLIAVPYRASLEDLRLSELHCFYQFHKSNRLVFTVLYLKLVLY
ncbi:hypothetical protein Hanom_Chr09g00797841 [Helianthus anomalus]